MNSKDLFSFFFLFVYSRNETKIFMYNIQSISRRFDLMNRAVDIAAEMEQIVEVVEEGHNLADEIPSQTEVVVEVPCLEHSSVEKALMEEESEVVVVVVVVAAVVAVDRQPDQEKLWMVDVLEEVIDVVNQDVLFVLVEIFVHDDV
jgi:hypothetical protein